MTSAITLSTSELAQDGQFPMTSVAYFMLILR